MGKHLYKTHIPKGPDKTLCGLDVIQIGKGGAGILPTANPRSDRVTCKNCLADYNGIDRRHRRVDITAMTLIEPKGKTS